MASGDRERLIIIERLMVKISRRPGITIVVVLLVSIVVLALVPLACTSDQEVTDLPPLELPDKGNPKLDSQLNQLIQAATKGEAVSFAEQHDIELMDGKVRVIIECLPGQFEAATKAATEAGAKVETSHDDLLQVLMPITNLTTLADTASIRFIRLPQYPVPETNK